MSRGSSVARVNCLDTVLSMSRSLLHAVSNLPNSTALQVCMHTGSVTYSCLWWYKFFIDEWRQNISQVFIFGFYFNSRNWKPRKNFYLYSNVDNFYSSSSYISWRSALHAQELRYPIHTPTDLNLPASFFEGAKKLCEHCKGRPYNIVKDVNQSKPISYVSKEVLILVYIFHSVS